MHTKGTIFRWNGWTWTPSPMLLVDVATGREVGRATATPGGVEYDPLGLAKALVGRVASDRDITDVEAVRWLTENGWSNGYVMVKLN